ncbi:MAG: peroxidase [Erythrobacter sp.]|nr:peroxidase [Erythrobacter sp.]
MSKLPSLPENPEMLDVLARYPQGFAALCNYHDAILRGPSELSVAERELIAAYVSGLNQCSFCHGSHRIYAELHGIDPDVFEKLVADPAAAGVDPRLLPLLEYARVLTQSPAMASEGLAQAVYAAGWSEEALFTCVSVTALFNLMNRLVEGTGITANPMARAASRERAAGNLANPAPYSQFATMVEHLHAERYGAGAK